LRIEALAASSVKIAGRDVLATWKVLISLGVTPFLYAFYAILATFVAVRANAPLKWKLWTPFLVIAALPCIGFAALKFGEAGMDVLKYVCGNTQIPVDPYPAPVNKVSPTPCGVFVSWSTATARPTQGTEDCTVQ
jgi:hypothetical protein